MALATAVAWQCGHRFDCAMAVVAAMAAAVAIAMAWAMASAVLATAMAVPLPWARPWPRLAVLGSCRQNRVSFAAMSILLP